LGTASRTIGDAVLPAADDAPPLVTASAPAANARDVPLDTRLVVRFSDAVRMDTLSSDTIRLTGARGELRTHVVGAEQGRLAFVWPLEPLEEGETYELTVDGTHHRDGPIDDPGTREETLMPGSALQGTVSLDAGFPRLRRLLQTRDVVVFWTYCAPLIQGGTSNRVGGWILLEKRPK
jgi:hypothetical protein